MGGTKEWHRHACIGSRETMPPSGQTEGAS